MRFAVLGHVEHIQLAHVLALPGSGDILHVDHPWRFAGGGGAMAFHQLTKSDAEAHFFTAIGADEAGRDVEAELSALPGRLHVARRDQPHARAVVLIPPSGDRTIVVIGRPLHPTARDPLPFDLLATCDGAYFTAEDPELLHLARTARTLVVTARRQAALRAAGIAPDVVVGSALDPLEHSRLSDYALPPRALVMTEAERGGTIETREGVARFAPTAVRPLGPSYGAGDSFAAALTYFMAAGLSPLDAATRASSFGAAVLGAQRPPDAQHWLP